MSREELMQLIGILYGVLLIPWGIYLGVTSQFDIWSWLIGNLFMALFVGIPVSIVATVVLTIRREKTD
jgi:hypothetical protein